MTNLWHMKLKRFIASWSLPGVKGIMILYTIFALFSYSEVCSYVSCRPGSYLSLWKQHDWWKIERYKVMYVMLQIVKVKRIYYYLKGVIFISHQTTCLSLWKQHDSWKIERYKVTYILLQIVKEGRINFNWRVLSSYHTKLHICLCGSCMIVGKLDGTPVQSHIHYVANR